MSDEEFGFGEPSCVLVEFLPTQVFSSLDKAFAFIEENGISPELITVQEMYFTPLGTATREVIIKGE